MRSEDTQLKDTQNIRSEKHKAHIVEVGFTKYRGMRAIIKEHLIMFLLSTLYMFSVNYKFLA